MWQELFKGRAFIPTPTEPYVYSPMPCVIAVDSFPELNLDNPKQIFSCDFPECRRSFVRQDLCTRHKERHTARGSQLQRKDAFMHNMNPFPTARPLDAVKDGEKFIPSPDSGALLVDSVSGADT